MVHAFRITGVSVIPLRDLHAVLAPLVGTALAVADLQRAADSLTDEYRRRGYTLAKAYLPEQEVRDGIVEIAVLEGMLGEVRVVGHTHYSSEFVERGFWRVKQEAVVRYETLEEALLLLNDHPNLYVTASLEPGRKVATTDVVATVRDERPVHVTVDYNNFGVPFISRNRFGAGVEIGNLLVEGSLLRVGGIIGDNPDRLLFQIGSFLLPLTRYGTRLVLSASNGRFDVGGQLASLQINGTIKTYDISVDHPIIRSRFQNLRAEAGFASKDNELFMLGQVTADDHLRMLKIGITYDRTDVAGRSFFSVYGFQGLGEMLGGMGDNHALASRQGADNRFTKAVVSAGRMHGLVSDLYAVVRATGQIATGPLPIIEQWLLGGPDSVRGYQLGEHLGDEGYSVNLEVRLPITRRVELLAFLDNGAVRVRNPAAGEQRFHSLTGVGPGLRLTLPDYDVALRFDVGFPIDPSRALGGSMSGGSSPTLYIQASARF
ncbi:ShlB/FhaC/HecB family hemolysin secretion/activation protein [Candidatus Nitrospira bockiana]